MKFLFSIVIGTFFMTAISNFWEQIWCFLSNQNNREIVGLFLPSIIAIIGISLAIYRIIQTDKQLAILHKRHERDGLKELEERFQKACDFLSHENDAIKLAGLTSIEDIVEVEPQRFANRSRTIIGALIRHFSELENKKYKNSQQYAAYSVGTIVTDEDDNEIEYEIKYFIIITSCFKSISKINNYIKNHNIKNIDNMDLKNLHFMGVKLKNLNLDFIDFTKSYFNCCIIQNCIIENTVLKDSNFTDVAK
jgi:hypothetical protein